MPTKSQYVTDDTLVQLRNHIEELKRAKAELQLANTAGLPMSYTVKDIDEQIASLEKIIRTYQAT